jgi:hypothetical protein
MGPPSGGEFQLSKQSQSKGEIDMAIDIKKYAGNGRFYKLEEVRNKPAREQIAVVKEGQFDRLNLVFESGRQVSLNKTSVGALMAEFGDDEKAWVSQWVLLTGGQVKDQYGEPIDALLAAPSSAKPTSPPTLRPKARPSSAEMDDEIPPF